jgi:hypothetical protein
MRCADARDLCVAKVAAGARVHSDDERKACGEQGRAFAARDRNDPVLQRLAQRFDNSPIELREFVQDNRFAISMKKPYSVYSFD